MEFLPEYTRFFTALLVILDPFAVGDPGYAVGLPDRLGCFPSVRPHREISGSDRHQCNESTFWTDSHCS